MELHANQKPKMGFGILFVTALGLGLCSIQLDSAFLPLLFSSSSTLEITLWRGCMAYFLAILLLWTFDKIKILFFLSAAGILGDIYLVGTMIGYTDSYADYGLFFLVAAVFFSTWIHLKRPSQKDGEPCSV